MKRILFAVIAVFCSMAVANAQESDNPKHLFGVRAGVNFSRMFDGDLFDDFTHKFGIGFHVGGSYEIAMSAKRKWYFQTGLNMNYHTAQDEVHKNDMYNVSGADLETQTISDNKYKALYLEIPAMFVRKIRITDDWGFRPSIGLTYALGVWGKGDEEKTQYKDNDVVSTVNKETELFSDDVLNGGGNWSRSSINGKIAIDFTYKHYLLGADLFYGITGDLWGIGLSVGYNF